MNLQDREKFVKSITRLHNISVGTDSTLILGGDPNRISLLVCAPNATRITLSPISPVALGSGLTLYAQDPPFLLKLDQMGGMLLGGLYGISETGAQVVTFIETTLIG